MAANRRNTVSVGALVALGAIALGVVALDQITKALVVRYLVQGEPSRPIIGDFLSFEFVKNSGAAFSFAAGSTWVFSIVALGVTLFIVWFSRRIRSLWWAVLFGLLLGGTVGNLADRVFREPGFGQGHVIDFLKIPLLPAIFNIADVAIVASMFLFVIVTVRGHQLDGTPVSGSRGAAHIDPCASGDDGAGQAGNDPTAPDAVR